MFNETYQDMVCLNPLFIRSFYQTAAGALNGTVPLRLNPLFIRSFYQTSCMERIMMLRLRLNPLFIRSFYQTSSASNPTATYGLNPLFIRSFYQTAAQGLGRHNRDVLIPYSSGHFIKRCASCGCASCGWS